MTKLQSVSAFTRRAWACLEVVRNHLEGLLFFVELFPPDIHTPHIHKFSCGQTIQNNF